MSFKHLSNSYDFFLRGEEILSGGQRIHFAPLLEERMKEAGVDPDTMREYVDGFKWGCPPVSILVQMFLKQLTDVMKTSARRRRCWPRAGCYVILETRQRPLVEPLPA